MDGSKEEALASMQELQMYLQMIGSHLNPNAVPVNESLERIYSEIFLALHRI